MSEPVTVSYGPAPEQAGELYLPPAGGPLVCLFHGGFWRVPHDRTQCTAIARDLAGRGYAVWNLGYRRVGAGGHPWPATREDVDAILATIGTLGEAHPAVDLRRVVFAGHSAGGHLAFWAAARRARAGSRFHVAGALGLAPILDLEAAFEDFLGRGAVSLFLDGTPAEVPERYYAASPRALLPLGVPQVVLHGDRDTAVPVTQSEAYVAAAQGAGDPARLHCLAGVDHMAFLDPGSGAHRATVDALGELTRLTAR